MSISCCWRELETMVWATLEDKWWAVASLEIRIGLRIYTARVEYLTTLVRSGDGVRKFFRLWKMLSIAFQYTILVVNILGES